MTVMLILVSTVLTSSPLLEVTDTIQRGGTAVYTVSLGEETVYWITLVSLEGATDLNLAAVSEEMDFDHFMSLPYGEDFIYAMEFAVATGLTDGDESVTVSAAYSGPFYIVVHDAGHGGGEYSLTLH